MQSPLISWASASASFFSWVWTPRERQLCSTHSRLVRSDAECQPELRLIAETFAPSPARVDMFSYNRVMSVPASIALFVSFCGRVGLLCLPSSGRQFARPSVESQKKAAIPNLVVLATPGSTWQVELKSQPGCLQLQTKGACRSWKPGHVQTCSGVPESKIASRSCCAVSRVQCAGATIAPCITARDIYQLLL